ncbi:MAG: hypothetical protein E3K38_03530 [Candidatus Kuenenia stuttgartiensis]|nr:hypothetical protein [Candidatus Kuenenia stuttgartiensis]
MIQNPIHKALLTFQNCSVRYLLMGGQACILYGGSEFSRDIDFSIGIDTKNISAIKKALHCLKAETIFVPPLGKQVLRRGHACHFRCNAEGVEGLRIDMMAKMLGCSDFEQLWERRSIVKLPEIGEMGILSLPDLIQAKKTQCEKDWPMIRRLIETDVTQGYRKAGKEKIIFWLMECRTPVLLMEIARKNAALCKNLIPTRSLLKAVLNQNVEEIESLLIQEESAERKKDREYWLPLKKELEQWRLGRKS